MKVVLFIFLCRLLDAALMMSPCKKLTGSKYKYKYETETETRVKGTSADTIGVRLTATVLLTISDSKDFAEIKVEAAEITPKSPPSLHSTKLFPELSRHPLAFKINNGRVIEIYPTAGEAEEILNIKRGIISAFQVTLTDTDGKRTVDETDVLGTCETTVTQTRVSANEIIILKNRDTDSCSKCGLFTILRQSEHQEARFVDGQMTAQYAVNNDGIIRVAFFVQVEKFMPLSAEAGEILTVIEQNLEFIDSPVVRISLSLCPVHVSMLNFNCITCVQQKEQDGLLDSRNQIELMADSPPHDIPFHFINLIEFMKKCSKRELDELKELYVQSRKVDAMSHHTKEANEAKKTMEKHTFFLDALAYVGTEQALDMIVELITEDSVIPLLNSSGQDELTLSLAFLPVHSTCPCLILKYALTVVKERPTRMIPKLVLGAVINKVWLLPTDSCPAVINEAVEFLISSIKTSLNKLPHDFDLHADEKLYESHVVKNGLNRSLQQYYDDAIHAIKSLGNAGVPQSLATLKSVISDKRLQTEGRTTTVYALTSMSQRVPDKVRLITLDIFYNKREEQEIRIAAFLTFMSSIASHVPKPNILTLMKAVQKEHNLYVKSFVCTYLMAIERSENPSILTLRRVVSYHMKASGLSLVCPAMDRGYLSSRATSGYVSLADAGLPRSLPRDVMGIGLSTGVLLDEFSWLPRSASGKVTANLFGYDMELFEVGVRGTGIQKLFAHLFGPTGTMHGGPRNRSLNPSGLRQSEMRMDMSDNVHVSAYLKVLGQEIGWKQWGEDTIIRKLHDHQNLKHLSETISSIMFGHFSSFRISDVVHNLVHFFNYVWKGIVPVHHSKVNITKTVRLMDVKRIIPTITGMPLNLTARVAGHLQLDGEGEINYSTRSVYNKIIDYFFPSRKPHSDEIHAWAELSPKFSVMSYMDLSLGAYHFEPKLVLVANATSNFTQKIKASLYENYTLSVKLLEVPESETCLLNASYTQFAEIDGSRFTLGIDKYNETMLYEPIGSSLLNMTLFSNISYPNGTGINQVPLFPLSGPARLTLTLVKETSNLEMVEFRLYDISETFVDEGLMNIELNLVGYQSKAGLSGCVNWVPPDSLADLEVHLDFVSSLANISGLFFAITHNRVDIEGSVSLTTAVSETYTIFRFNRDHFYARVGYKRHSPEPRDRPSLLREPIIKIPEFYLEVNGSLADNTDGKTSVALLTEGSDEPHWLKINYMIRGLMVDISATSSLFHNVSMFYVLPYPLKPSICYVFDGHNTHVITFDVRKQEYQLNPGCEYVLVHHDNDAFAVTLKNKEIMIYVNGTKYTLTPNYTMLKVNDIDTALPYKQKHIIHVRNVTGNGHQYIHFSVWVGVDIYYSGGDIQLDINGLYMNQIAGLCGNANYKSEDDMMLPELSFAETEKDMASGWNVSCDKVQAPTPATNPPDCNRAVTNQTCNFFFSDIVQDARAHVEVIGFYHACLSDVSFCQSPLSSISAYLRAAHAKQIDITACVYGNWSEWSMCSSTDHLQYRERPVLNDSFSEICGKKVENRSCEKPDKKCVVKEHAILKWGSKFCNSTHRVLQCAPGCHGTYTTRVLDFHCINKAVPEWNPYNTSSVKLRYNRYIVNCWEP